MRRWFARRLTYLLEAGVSLSVARGSPVSAPVTEKPRNDSADRSRQRNSARVLVCKFQRGRYGRIYTVLYGTLYISSRLLPFSATKNWVTRHRGNAAGFSFIGAPINSLLEYYIIKGEIA